MMGNVSINIAGIIVAVVIALVVAVIVLNIVKQIKHTINRTLNSQVMHAAKTIVNSLNENPTGVPPYPVPQLTAVYRPKIERDFPEMSFDRFESMARNGMIAILNAVESKRIDSVENSSQNLKNQLKVLIEDYNSRNEDIHYDNVDIHAVAIENYYCTKDTASMIFQISLQSLAYRTRNGAVVSGSNTVPRQNLFSLTLMHNQKGDGGNQHYFEANCPNCGAPVDDLSSRRCSFCGTGLVPVVDKIWQIDSFKLLK